jgi:hypothetical protein
LVDLRWINVVIRPVRQFYYCRAGWGRLDPTASLLPGSFAKGTDMNRLAFALFPMVATTLMGIAVIAVLTMDIWATGQPILWAAVAGFVISIPVSWWIGRQLTALTRPRGTNPSA